MYKILKKLNLLIFFSILFGKLYSTNVAIKKCPNMTIFVHGIVKSPWTIADYFHITHNNVEKSRYKYAAEYLRQSQEYFSIQPMQNLGLRKIDLDKKYPTSAAAAIATIFKMTDGKEGDLYYTFGWSGLFSRYHREQEGKNFFYALLQELEILKKSNIYPKIRVIGFSHGGNVSLYLANYMPSRNLPFVIDNLSLIGTPIQKETDHLITHPVFKKVYNFYSDEDIAQVADFLTTKYGRSSRRFNPRKDFPLPDKLTQIQLKILKIVTDKNGKLIRVITFDPNHLELWTFGWIQRIYRENFPLNPLPMATLIPTILNAINCINYELSNDIQVTFIPKRDLLVIKDKKNKIRFDTYLPNSRLKELKNCALQFKIEFPYCQHIQLIKNSLNYATNQRKLERQTTCKRSLKFRRKIRY